MECNDPKQPEICGGFSYKRRRLDTTTLAGRNHCISLYAYASQRLDEHHYNFASYKAFENHYFMRAMGQVKTKSYVRANKRVETIKGMRANE